MEPKCLSLISSTFVLNVFRSASIERLVFDSLPEAHEVKCSCNMSVFVVEILTKIRLYLHGLVNLQYQIS